MNIEEFREYCLSLKGVYEKMPFTNVPDKYRELAVVIPEKTDSAITADERIADDPYNGYIRNFDVEKVTSELQKEMEMAVTNPETEQIIRNYNG